MGDPENNREVRNLSSGSQEPAIKKIFYPINYCDASTPASVITAKLHSGLLMNQNQAPAGREVSNNEYYPSKGNNMVS